MPAPSSAGPRRSKVSRTPRPPILSAIAGDDRAGLRQKALTLLGEPTVVDARDVESVAGRKHERVAATLAEADHADLARAVVPLGKPCARGVKIAERLRLHARGRRVSEDTLVHCPDLTDEGDHACDPATPVVEVRTDGEI